MQKIETKKISEYIYIDIPKGNIKILKLFLNRQPVSISINTTTLHGNFIKM